jgi:hypothetical protein
VAVLVKIYAKCLDGQDAIAKRRIEEALGDPGESDDSEPPTTPARTAENFNAYSTRTGVESRQRP